MQLDCVKLMYVGEQSQLDMVSVSLGFTDAGQGSSLQDRVQGCLRFILDHSMPSKIR